MAYSYNVEEVPREEAPCIEHDIRRAKMFLQKHSPESGDSLYDHLTEVVAKILAERPRNVVDFFEEYSRKVKEDRFKTRTDRFRDSYHPPDQYEDARKLIKLFQRIKQTGEREEQRFGEEEETEEDDGRKRIPNMMELLFYFEQTNVGLPRSEMILLNLAIRKLMSDRPLENVRFWGKILGSPKNYYVVEAELTQDELDRRLEKLEAEAKAREEQLANREPDITEPTVTAEVEKEPGEDANAPVKIPGDEQEEEKEGLKLIFPPMPVNPWQPEPEIPPERIGTGANKKVYFVCNSPGLDDWIELPPVSPRQIITARQIVRYCTGNLDCPIHTFPPFPGTERNYLRAQVARISGTTHVSPIGFLSFGGEDEEEEIGEERQDDVGGEMRENPNYDPLPVKDLVDPSMSNWCHHSPYVLRQGRVTWWDPSKPDEELEEEEAEEEEEELEDDGTRSARPQKEVGPPLLTPLSEDAIQDSIVPWTALQSSQVQPDTAVALVRSNIWPGAFAFATGKRFANVYVGWGQKYMAYNYSPPSMPPVQDQYTIGPEIMEIQDPSFEEEEAYRIAHLPPSPEFDLGEDEGMEEEEEEEDDEEDDE